MQCKWITSEGQCPRASDVGNFCKDHGPVDPDQALKHYQITNVLVGDTHARHSAVGQIKDLREEIALTRAMIEARLNLSSGEAEFVASMGILHQYLATVEKLVSACHRMDSNLGNVLNKTSVIQLAQDMVAIIFEELEGVDGRDAIIDRIAHKIIETIGSATNKEKS